MSTLRILLADDHAVVREGLRALLNSQPDMEVVGEAQTGRSAWELAVAMHPDIIVMDVAMPELDGAEATKLIRRDCPDTRVVALTVHETQAYLRRLLDAGVSGYIPKRAAAEDLLRAIRGIAKGQICIDPKLAADLAAAQLSRMSLQRRGEAELTDREIEVIQLLARGLINREIAEELNLSVKTIEVHRARALWKLGLRTRSEVVRFAQERGWLKAETVPTRSS
jgi:DNA-binding NarL/FixJ family response regulator